MEDIIVKLNEIATNIRVLKYTVDNHIGEQRSINEKMIFPLWDESQRHKGAAGVSRVLYSFVGASLALIIQMAVELHK